MHASEFETNMEPSSGREKGTGTWRICVGRLSPRLTLLTSARFRTLSTTSSGCFFHGEDMVCTLEEETKTRVGETPLLVQSWASSLQLYPGPGLTVSRQSWDYDGAVFTSDVEGREAGVRKRLECLAAPDLSAYGARRAPYTIHVCLRALEPSSARTLQSLGDKAAPGVW